MSSVYLTKPTAIGQFHPVAYSAPLTSQLKSGGWELP